MSPRGPSAGHSGLDPGSSPGQAPESRTPVGATGRSPLPARLTISAGRVIHGPGLTAICAYRVTHAPHGATRFLQQMRLCHRVQPFQGFNTGTSAARKSLSLRVQTTRECTLAVAAMKRSGWLNVIDRCRPRATIRRHSRMTSSSTGRMRPANHGRN